jgi:hypothetical protein
MNRLLYTLFLCGMVLPALAQKPVFGNEWLNYQQTYYRIPVAQKGLYRLTTNDLQKAGLSTATLDPRTLQVFHRGVEQAIWVEGEADGKLDATDYLEFLGRGNDGVPDSALYRPASAQPHPYYSLYSDTTAFFLTARVDGQPGRRMARYTDLDMGTGTSTLMPEPFVWVDNLLVISDQWSGGMIYPIGAAYNTGALLSSQDVGEGWMGASVKPKATYTQRVSFGKSVATPQAAPSLELIVIGRTPVAHSVQVRVGTRTLAPLELMNFETKTLTIPLSASEAVGDVACTISPQNANDEVSMAVLRATYPHQPDMGSYTYREFRLNPAASGRTLLRLTNVPAAARIYDITTPGQTSILSGTLVNGTFTSVVRGANTARTLLMVSTIQAVPAIQRVAFRNLNPARINFAIVASPLLRKPIPESPDVVTAYAAYRASKAGGSYDTLTINTTDLYNQFNYGERSILAVRRLADYLARGSSNTKHLLLMGRSIDPRQLNLRRSTPQVDTLDMIPNGSFPGSDLVMVTGLAGRPAFVPAMAVGRIFASRPSQVLDYLNKLKEHEAVPNTALWRKQTINLSGGQSAYELSLFRAFTESFARSLAGPNTCANAEIISKKTDNPVEDIPIANQVNRGVGIVSLFGHSGLAEADANIGYVSDDRLGYRNRGRYPLLLANGCAAGDFYYYIRGFRTFITDWVLTPQRGSIIGLANSYNGFASPLKNYSDQLYAVMTDSAWVGKTFGEIQVESIARYLAAFSSVYDKANAEQLTLQGDPAIRPFPFTKPDLTFSSEGVQVKNADNALTLRAVALNGGRGTGRAVQVRVRGYEADGRVLFTTTKRLNAATFADTLTVTVPAVAATNPFYEFYADADGLIDEERRDNNVLRFDKTGKVADLPFDIDNTPPVVEVAFDGRRIRNDDLVSPQPAIEVLVSDENSKLAATASPAVELYLQRPCAQQPCPFGVLGTTAPAATWTKRGAEWVLTYRPPAALPSGVYTLEAYGSDLSGNRAQPYSIRFQVRTDPAVVSVQAAPNPFSSQTTIRYTLTGTQTPPPATLRIVDLAGRDIRTVELKSVLGANEYVWDGTGSSGTPLPAGTYLYRLDLPGYATFENDTQKQLTGKLLLTR